MTFWELLCISLLICVHLHENSQKDLVLHLDLHLLVARANKSFVKFSSLKSDSLVNLFCSTHLIYWFVIDTENVLRGHIPHSTFQVPGTRLETRNMVCAMVRGLGVHLIYFRGCVPHSGTFSDPCNNGFVPYT